MWKSKVVLNWEKKNLKKKPQKKIKKRACSYWCTKYKDPKYNFFICPNCKAPRPNLFIDYFELPLNSKVLDLEEITGFEP